MKKKYSRFSVAAACRRAIQILLAVVVFGSLGHARAAHFGPTNPPGFFDDQISEIEADFNALNQLEQLVSVQNLTRTDLQTIGHPLLQSLAPDAPLSDLLLETAAAPGKTKRLWKIPGFLWGFCLGGIGVLLVHKLIKNKESKAAETRAALIGLGFLMGLAGAAFVLLNWRHGLAE